MIVRVHVERLVLDGLPVNAAQASALQAAMQAELGRLIRSGGIGPQSSGAIPRVVAPPAQVHGASPKSMGERVAASVYRGLGSKR